MGKAFNLAIVLLLAACTAAIPKNEYGLRVVPDLRTYERLAAHDPDQRLVDLERAIPGIALDIRYATPNNVTHRQLYPVAKAFLRAPAARALANVQKELASQGLGLKVFDAYRPYSVTKALWEPVRNPDYAADPAKGSRHNRGAAIDLTLIDLKSGRELPMPTGFDDFTPRAHQDFMELPPDVIANRAKLREVMTRHGFEPLPTEWWHFDFRGWERFELMDVPVQNLITADMLPTLKYFDVSYAASI